MGQYRVYTFGLSSLSSSKCRHLQSFLQGAKANVLRLNELSHPELLQMAALTSAQLVIIQAFASHSQPAESVWLIWGVQLGVCGNCPSRGGVRTHMGVALQVLGLVYIM